MNFYRAVRIISPCAAGSDSPSRIFEKSACLRFVCRRMQGRDQIGGGDYAVYHRGFSGDSDYDGFRSSRAFGEAVRTDSGASGDTEGTDLFMIMRPVSGSGTLAIIENIAQTFGPDSFLCRCASVMMGSSETLLYAVAVYFGATRVSSLRHTIPAGVAGYAAGIWLSIVLCKIM